MPLVLLIVVIVVVVACADITNSPPRPREQWIGRWRADSVVTVLPEFRGATNLEIKFFSIEVLGVPDGTPLTKFHARLAGELVVTLTNGIRKEPIESVPMYIEGDAFLVGGPSGLVFRINKERESFELEREGSGAFKAKLKRISLDPGKPEFLPPWANAPDGY